MRILWMVVAAVVLSEAASHARILGGDSIGPDSSLTDNNAGGPATFHGADNFGMPAIQVELEPSDRVRQLDVVVFGAPSAAGLLDFADFDYVLNVWQSDDYFSGLSPSMTVDISSALQGVTLTEVSPNVIRPVANFGVVGPVFPGTPTHLFTFDLDSVPELSQPIGAGSFVFAFQSDHDVETSGTLGVSGSVSSTGPLPLFSVSTTAGSEVPRGILGNQDPSKITLRWGINLSGRTPGDYDDDGSVTSADYGVWKSHFGELGGFSINGENADGNENGVVDAADYTVWRNNLSGMAFTGGLAALSAVPEPSGIGITLVAIIPFMMVRRSTRCRE